MVSVHMAEVAAASSLAQVATVALTVAIARIKRSGMWPGSHDDDLLGSVAEASDDGERLESGDPREPEFCAAAGVARVAHEATPGP